MKRLFRSLLILSLTAPFAHAAVAKPAAKPIGKPVKDGTEDKSKVGTGTFAGLQFRNIGPALTSGRISDLAVDPNDHSTWYVAASYGGVWKTTNAGTTFSPIFDGQKTSSIGCLRLDPNNPLTLWVGTGENNSQRSVGWGDGIYRSIDGGKSFQHMGLKASEHIGMIQVHPTDSRIVFAAAQGPLWAPGGDRGLYKSVDAGGSWKAVLAVDQWTGCNEVYFDPQDPRVMYASTYQRHRKVWTLLDGGPGSGIYKSVDGGDTWKKLTNGLPDVDMGRIGLAVSAVSPNTLYAIVEAQDGKGGIYASFDGGANWSKQDAYVSGSPQYYQELVADPKQAGRVYSMDTFLMVSDDHGKSWRRAGEKHKHVDNHAMWIDPADNRHAIVGCDGGLYETFDRCATYQYFPNLPITQFYKLEVDNSLPFYNVYGGTQDNNTQGGPSRTNNVHGIRNSDWFITLGGDGFQPRVDPKNPDIVYSQYQNAGLYRFDRRTGNGVDIQPQVEPGEDGPRWNWDSPLIISPFANTRLYFCSQRVYRSDDRGDAWTPVSGDLTRGVDRNRLPVMGRVWSVDAVAKNASTSVFGNIVWIDESPKVEGLLYVGTDDGLIQVSEDGGRTWRRFDSTSLVGEYAYVSRVVPSQHDANTVYAVFDRHKAGDFRALVFRSTDRGRSWTDISADLPDDGSSYAFVEDHKDPSLLFVGTEFGLFMTQDGGRRWVPLKSGLPPVCIRDMAIQKREDDLVLGTFSRGFYILDDMSPLRLVKDAQLAEEAALLPVRRTLLYEPAAPMGGNGPAQQGAQTYVAPNPPTGAVFTYRLAEGYKTRKDARRAKEKAVQKAGGDNFYPAWDSLRAETREDEPSMILTVTDAQGDVVRRIKGPAAAGFHRVAWDLRYPEPEPATLTPRVRGEFEDAGGGPYALPGTYTVALAKRVNGVTTALGPSRSFEVVPLGGETIPQRDRAADVAFQRKVTRALRALQGANRLSADALNRTRLLEVALHDTPGKATADLLQQAAALESRLLDLNVVLSGDAVLRSRNEAYPPSLNERVRQITGGAWSAFQNTTRTHQRNLEIASSELDTALASLKAIVADLEALEAKAEAAGAPWTPGRLPQWKPE